MAAGFQRWVSWERTGKSLRSHTRPHPLYSVYQCSHKYHQDLREWQINSTSLFGEVKFCKSIWEIQTTITGLLNMHQYCSKETFYRCCCYVLKEQNFIMKKGIDKYYKERNKTIILNMVKCWFTLIIHSFKWLLFTAWIQGEIVSMRWFEIKQ